MRISPILLAGLVMGCEFQEVLQEQDLKGTVRIPKEALDLTLIDDEGVERVISGDIRMLGPVYLGAFPSVEEGHYAFQHPEMGPILDADYPGDTYPYGGTSVGRFDFGCYEQLVCKVVTGRYESYDDVLDFFRDVVEDEVKGSNNEPVGSGMEYRERCYESQDVTSNNEIAFVDDDPYEDVKPYFKPYFEEDGDDWVADVVIPHTLVETDMKLWGWVDMPSPKFKFVTCDEAAGDYFYEYSEQYYQGASFPDVLNYPGLYIDDGDWVVDNAPSVTVKKNGSVDDFELTLDFKYED
jgi:hypothetical protein